MEPESNQQPQEDTQSKSLTSSLETDTTQPFSSHQRKEIQRKEREEHRKKEEHASVSSKKRKSWMWKGAFILVILGLTYWVYQSISTTEKPFTSGDVHWHTKLHMSICGRVKNLPRIGSTEHHLGLPLLHTHDDDLVHVEGRPWKKEEIALGRFFDAINVHFDTDRFFDKKNGDLCDGVPGKVKMWVDGKESTEFRGLLALDGQNVKIAFEP